MWKQAHLEFESWLIFGLENEIVENFEIVANVEDFTMTENDSSTRATKVKVGNAVYTSSISTLC